MCRMGNCLKPISNAATVTGTDCSLHLCKLVPSAPFIILQASFGGVVTMTVPTSKPHHQHNVFFVYLHNALFPKHAFSQNFTPTSFAKSLNFVIIVSQPPST